MKSLVDYRIDRLTKLWDIRRRHQYHGLTTQAYIDLMQAAEENDECDAEIKARYGDAVYYA